MKRITKHVAGLLDARLRTRRAISQLQTEPAEPLIEFDEAWYLRAYPDVARAVAAGVYASARAHYLHRGVEEGRSTGAQWKRIAPDAEIAALRERHSEASYLVPQDLSISPGKVRRTIVFGSCLSQVWANHRDVTMAHPPEFFLSSLYTILPEAPPHAASEYDFLIIQIPARCISSDDRLWRLAYGNAEGHRRAFEEACAAIDLFVDNHLAWAFRFGIPAFVTNFFLPQGDLTGRLLPRYDLRNIVHFYGELNRHIETSIKRYPRAYLLDIDRIAASFGRRFVQDDGVLWAKHGSVMPTEWPSEARIEPMPAMRDHYEVTWPSYFVAAVWAEAMAMHRTLTQVDPVKLVVLDLDDTLWMGVSGDDAQIGAAMVESWPLGIAEALMYLKKRGILLAIVSKNDEDRIRSIWPSIFGAAITLEDFAVIRINWRRKSENMMEILEAVNLLPLSTVFIDDNPVERAEMQSVFPQMRILGRYPFYIRRTLL